jgi:predicted RNase H-like nuclease
VSMGTRADVPCLDGPAYVGVDGCRAGWLAVHREGGALAYRIHEDVTALMRTHSAPSMVLIDVPIGLPWHGQEGRPCDALARRVLGPARAPSVFSPPCRSAAKAGSTQEARQLNLAALGRSLSAQAWGICSKVAEVDSWLLEHPDERPRLLEVHPEVCFWGLNGQRPMLHRKSSKEGRAERLALLNSFEPEVHELLEKVLAETRRKDVAADDVLDALVAMLTGSVQRGALQALHGSPDRDERGLPMQMLFRDVDAG